MNVDSQGVRRGSCTRCVCKEFITKHVKCQCGHPPTAHVDLATGHSSASGLKVSRHVKDNVIIVTNTSTGDSYSGYHRQSSRQSQLYQQNPGQRSCHRCSSMYSADVGACPVCYQRDNCPCGNMKFCDPVYGVFQYCSPSCRDNYLLPEYNKKLQEYLSNSSHINDTPPGVTVDFRNAAYTLALDATSTSVATGRATGSTSVVRTEMIKQSTICKMLPKIRRCVHFYKNVWSEGDKYGLYVTGLTLGENTTLCLADLICGITSDVFDNKTTYDDMIAKYDTVTAGYGRIFRKSNFDLICKKAQEKGLAKKCGAESQNIAFFLQNTPISGIGLQTKDQQVIILEVNKGSIAELSGICNGDIIRCIGSVNQDQMDKIEFKDVTKQKNVTSVLTTQSLNVIGSVLIIERPTTSYV